MGVGEVGREVGDDLAQTRHQLCPCPLMAEQFTAWGGGGEQRWLLGRGPGVGGGAGGLCGEWEPQGGEWAQAVEQFLQGCRGEGVQGGGRLASGSCEASLHLRQQLWQLAAMWQAAVPF